jgi:hypothetical protein
MFKFPSAIGLARPLAAVALAAYAMGAVAAHAGVITLTLPATADIFLAGQTTVPAQGSEGSFFPQQTAGGNFNNGAGTLPEKVTVGPGGVIVSATGTWSCGVGCTSNGPAGSTQWTLGVSTKTIGPFTVASYTGVTTLALVGAWGGSDPSTAAFLIGAGPVVLKPPAGDDVLYLGTVDAFGQSGGTEYAGTYNDNIGQLGITVTSIAEPASWALMVLGFAGLGFAGYRRTRAPSLV